MKVEEKNSSSEKFLIQITIVMFLYITVILLIGCFMPRYTRADEKISIQYGYLSEREFIREEKVVLNEQDVIQWKALLFYSMPILFSLASCSFYAMKMKEAYIVSSCISICCLLARLNEITIFQQETYVIILYAMVLFLGIFIFPLVVKISSEKSSYVGLCLGGVYFIIEMMDVVLYRFNECVYLFNNLVFLLFKTIVSIIMLTITLCRVRNIR